MSEFLKEFIDKLKKWDMTQKNDSKSRLPRSTNQKIYLISFVITICCMAVIIVLYRDLNAKRSFERCKELYEAERYGECIECLKSYEAKNKDIDSDAYKMRGMYYYLNNQDDKAIEDFTKFLKKNKTGRAIYYVRGLCYENVGKTDEAIQDLEKACDFGYDKACNHLSSVYGSDRTEDQNDIDITLVYLVNLKDSTNNLIKRIDDTKNKINEIKGLKLTKASIGLVNGWSSDVTGCNEIIELTAGNIKSWSEKIDENDVNYPQWKESIQNWNKTVEMWNRMEDDWIAAQTGWAVQVKDNVSSLEVMSFYWTEIQETAIEILIACLLVLLIFLFIESVVRAFLSIKKDSMEDREHLKEKRIIRKELTRWNYIVLIVFVLLHIVLGIGLTSVFKSPFYLLLLTVLVWIYLIVISRPLLGTVIGGFLPLLVVFSNYFYYFFIRVNPYQTPFEILFLSVIVFFIGCFLGFVFSFISLLAKKEKGLRKDEVIFAVCTSVCLLMSVYLITTNTEIPNLLRYSITIILILYVCRFLVNSSKPYFGLILGGIYSLIICLPYFVDILPDDKLKALLYLLASLVIGGFIAFNLTLLTESTKKKRKRYFIYFNIGYLLFFGFAYLTLSSFLSMPIAELPQKKKSIISKNEPELLIQRYHSGPPLRLKFSHDGKYLFSSGIDNTLIVWDTSNMKVVKTIRYEYEEHLDDLFISESMKCVVVCFSTDNRIDAYNIDDGKLIWTMKGTFPHFMPGLNYLILNNGFVVSVIDIATGKKVHVLNHEGLTRKDDLLSHIAPNNYIVIEDWTEKRLFIWEVENGDLIKDFRFLNRIVDLNFSNESNSMIIEFDDGITETYDLNNFKKVKKEKSIKFESRLANCEIESTSDDLSFAILQKFDKKNREYQLSLYDFKTGKFIRDLKQPEFTSHTTDISADVQWERIQLFENDKKLLATNELDENSIYIWDLRSGEIEKRVNIVNSRIQRIELYGDRYIAISAFDGKVILWDLTNSITISSDSGALPTDIAFNVTTNSFVCLDLYNDIYIWNFKNCNTRKLVNEKGSKASIKLLDVIGNPKWIGTIYNDKIVYLVNDKELLVWSKAEDKNYRPIIALDSKDNYISFGLKQIVYLAFISKLNYLWKYDVNAFYVDNRRLIISQEGWSYPLNVFDAKSGNHLLNLINFTDGNWIVYTPDGYFDCSPEAAKYVTWKVGDQVYSFDQYWDEYYVPDLLYKVLNEKFIPGETPNIPIPPKVEIVQPKDILETSKDTVSIEVKATDDVKVDEVVIALNGRPITKHIRGGIKVIEDKGDSITLSADVPLQPGENTITVYAYDNRRTRSDDESITVTLKGKEEEKGNLYVLAVGISNYKNKAYKLDFAADDAEAIGDVLKDKAKPLFDKVSITALTDKEATTQGILNAVSDIQKKITMNDVLMIFLAGHGAKDKDYQFYFVTYESDLAHLTNKTAMGWKNFQEILRDTKAKNVIMMLDTCHSGDALDPESPYITADRLIGQMERISGVIVLSSSTGSEYSIELPELKHGVYTYAVVEALKGAADFIKDRKIFIGEMNLYVPAEVEKLTKGRQTPSIPRMENFTDFPIATIQ